MIIFLIVFTTFITFIAGYDQTWKMWFVLPFSFGFLYICGKLFLKKLNFVFNSDMLFTDESSFVYEPDYYNWKDQMEGDAY